MMNDLLGVEVLATLHREETMLYLGPRLSWSTEVQEKTEKSRKKKAGEEMKAPLHPSKSRSGDENITCSNLGCHQNWISVVGPGFWVNNDLPTVSVHPRLRPERDVATASRAVLAVLNSVEAIATLP
jgi:hypothetical protein